MIIRLHFLCNDFRDKCNSIENRNMQKKACFCPFKISTQFFARQLDNDVQIAQIAFFMQRFSRTYNSIKNRNRQKKLVFVHARFQRNFLQDNLTTAGPPASAAKVEFLMFFPLRDNGTSAGPPDAQTIVFHEMG